MRGRNRDQRLAPGKAAGIDTISVTGMFISGKKLC
jgi:hypothetical protein